MVYTQAKSELNSACEVTSLKADVSPGLPPPSMRTPGFGANPWERTEGALVRPSEEQARLIRQQQAADTPGSSQRAASARPGAPPRRSEDARARTERSIAEHRRWLRSLCG